MKRFLLVSGGIILLLVVAAVIFVVTSLDQLVKRAIEKYGSEMTQVSVRVDGVSISLKNGAGSISGLSIANPADFSTAHFLTFGEISMKLDEKSLAKDPMIIDEIRIKKPDVTYELTPKGSNLGTIENNVQNYLNHLKRATGASASTNQEGPSKHRVVIRDLYIEDGSIDVSTSLLGGQSATAKLPAIHLQNIGGESGGVGFDQAFGIIFGVLSQQIIKVVSTVDIGKYTSQLKNSLNKEKDILQNPGQELENTGKELNNLLNK